MNSQSPQTQIKLKSQILEQNKIVLIHPTMYLLKRVGALSNSKFQAGIRTGLSVEIPTVLFLH